MSEYAEVILKYARKQRRLGLSRCDAHKALFVKFGNDVTVECYINDALDDVYGKDQGSEDVATAHG